MKKLSRVLGDLKSDLPSGLVVYFVALPLCLAIAGVSTGNSEFAFSGIIAGAVGGILVGAISGSALGVSGPAAGLVVIVSDGIRQLGTGSGGETDYYMGFTSFLLALCIAGLIQMIAGLLKAGIIGHYFPSTVIKGMLAAIGITIILKEFPHLMGYDKDFMGDESFEQADGHNTITEIYYAIRFHSIGAIIIAAISILLLILFEHAKLRKFKLFKFIPGALIVVVTGIVAGEILRQFFPGLQLRKEQLVQLPVASTFAEFSGFFTFPDLTQISNPKVWKLALSVAVIASLETLLSLEATDKLDKLKRKTPPNRELIAQGTGNLVCGLIGGLPVTQVIVRSSANINSGGKTKKSTIIHGIVLLSSALLIPRYINMIPLACLAAILIIVGYKLAKVSLFLSIYRTGWNQFIPFIVTIGAILSTDLLKGIAVGIAFAFFIIIRSNYRSTSRKITEFINKGKEWKIEFPEVVTFLNKGILLMTLNKVPPGSVLLLDASKTRYIDRDVMEVLREYYQYHAVLKDISIRTINLHGLGEKFEIEVTEDVH